VIKAFVSVSYTRILAVRTGFLAETLRVRSSQCTDRYATLISVQCCFMIHHEVVSCGWSD